MPNHIHGIVILEKDYSSNETTDDILHVERRTAMRLYSCAINSQKTQQPNTGFFYYPHLPFLSLQYTDELD